MFSGTVLSDLNRQTYKDLNYDLYDSTMNGVVAAVRMEFLNATFVLELLNCLFVFCRKEGLFKMRFKTEIFITV